MTRDAATMRQVEAASPRNSTWLSANAGSGKTRVLTDRVARLLLDGVSPANILCLTYTKAAAAEMQNRLFRNLGRWAMMQEDKLHATLLELGVDGEINSDRLATARRLFAQAMEVPGGLKIQTIHAFCASVLRRFPLEAGITPAFREMEDRDAELLRLEVAEEMAQNPEDCTALDRVFFYLGGGSFDAFLADVAAKRAAFFKPYDPAEMAMLLGLPTGMTPEQLLNETYSGADQQSLADFITLCAKGSIKDIGAAEKLSKLDLNAPPRLADLDCLEDVFLYGAKTKTPYGPKNSGSTPVPTKGTREKNPALIEAIDDLMERVAAGRSMRLAFAALSKTEALWDFAQRFVLRYEEKKLLGGQLDFDDLIEKTRALLQDSAVAQWVLFRLDGGIDHILVDEAQDTSPQQWEVIKSLAAEFASGEGARAESLRTIFVVGDMKQSIYSFQGADPAAFEEMRQMFDRNLAEAGVGLNTLTLAHSFRSSSAILKLVDTVFSGPHAEGLGPEKPRHLAFKEQLPGRVDLWPTVDKVSEAEDEAPWYAPVDRTSPRHHNIILAERIAAACRQMVDHETLPCEGETRGSFARRPVTEGDILILVQRRSSLFHAIISSLKKAGLRVAGADRLKIGAELAVRDIAALLRFLSLAEDDLSLAAALRSPLFGWSEQMLFSLAHHRHKGSPLWQALRVSSDPAHRETLAILEDLRRESDFLRPYDLMGRILIRHEGRQKLLARLGHEAEDGIDALLAQALSYEQGNIPDLTGFLEWMEADEIEIKRQFGAGANQIRVMTVHGSKGLEAPIVIMPDTAKRTPKGETGLTLRDGIAFWPPSKDDLPDYLAEAREEARRKRDEESRRLLYVALTRAECWLIVCAAGETGPESWHGMVEEGLQAAGAVQLNVFGEEGLRLSHLDWLDLPLIAPRLPDPSQANGITPPRISEQPLPATSLTLSPSDLGGAKAIGQEGDDEALQEQAMLRGTIFHLLLEHLPQTPAQDRRRQGLRLIELVEDYALAGDPEEIVAAAESLLIHPELADVFGPESLAEVAISAEINGQRFHGVIDRLRITEERILAVDFKTNRRVASTAEATPEGILRQMGAYQAMLRAIYPKRKIEMAILWTATGTLLALPDNLVAQALARALPQSALP